MVTGDPEIASIMKKKKKETMPHLPAAARSLIKNPEDFIFDDPYDSDINPDICIADTEDEDENENEPAPTNVESEDESDEVEDWILDDDDDEEEDENEDKDEEENEDESESEEESDDDNADDEDEDENEDESAMETDQADPIYNAERIVKQRISKGRHIHIP